MTQKQKHGIIYDHFLHHLGTHVPRSCLLNLEKLGWQPRDHNALEETFTEQEVQSVVLSTPKEKAPRLMGTLEYSSLTVGTL
jgi:hypothetical protein